MKIEIFIFLCLLLARSVAANDVLVVENAKDWQVVMDSASAWIVGFTDTVTAKKSGDMTQEMMEELKEHMEEYGVRFSSVDCGVKTNKKLCRTMPRKTVPSFAFVTEIPQMNPYSHKNHRAVVMYDSAPGGGVGGDLRSLERKFAKIYPNSVEKVTSDELSRVVAASGGKGAILYMSPKDNVNLFAKSICYAFQGMQCMQWGNWNAQLAKDILHFTEDDSNGNEESSRKGVIGYLSAENKFTVYVPKGSDVSKEREGVLNFLSQATGQAAETTNTSASASATEDDANEKEPSASSPLGKVVASTAFDGELDTNVAWLVRVYIEGQGTAEENKSNEAAWKKTVSGACEGSILPIQVQCPATAIEENEGDRLSFGHKLCQRRGLPYTALIPFYGSDAPPLTSRKSPEALSAFDISDGVGAKKAALASLPEQSVHVIHETELDAILGAALQKKSTCLIALSNSEDPPIVLRNIANSLDKYVTVAFISEPSAEFLTRVGVTSKLPTVILAAPPPAGSSDAPPGGVTVMQYESSLFGPLKYTGLQNFVLSAYQRSGLMEEAQATAASESQNPDHIAADITGTLQKEVVSISSEEQWQTECSSLYKGLCVVGLLTNSDFDDSAAILDAAMKHLGKRGAAFKFVSVDGQCQASFSGRFDVQTDTLPRVVAYSPSKARYMLMSSTMNTDNLSEFLSSALTGKAHSYMIPQRPELSSQCEMQDFGADEVVEDEDMDDLLSEIRKDEEVAAAARKLARAQEKKAFDAKAKADAAAAAKPKTIKKVVKKKKKAPGNQDEL